MEFFKANETKLDQLPFPKYISGVQNQLSVQNQSLLFQVGCQNFITFKIKGIIQSEPILS